MRQPFNFGVAAAAMLLGGGSFYLGAAKAPAFVQATMNGATGQSATTGTTTSGATAQPQGRVSRPRPGAGGTDVRGGQGRPGVLTTPDAVPPANTELTARDCNRVGGTVGNRGAEGCSTGLACRTTIATVVNGRTVVREVITCIDQLYDS